MKRAATCALLFACLISLRAQSVKPPSPQGADAQDEPIVRGKAVRAFFEKQYPPGKSYAVVLRQDLPTVSAKAREHGYPVEVGDNDWKGPGSMFRARTTGNLAFGEVVKVDEVDFSNNRVEMRLVSTDAHTIVVDPDRPDKNEQAQVVTLLVVPHRAGLDELVQVVDGYVRLFPSLDAAREYARTILDPQPARRFTIGVMRRDGILLPIAAYDNGHWFRRWPIPFAERDVPIAMRDVPAEWWGIEGVPAKWTAWVHGQSRPVKVSAPLAFGAHCLMNVGLRTDYRSPLPAVPLDQHHYPKDGIATTGSLPVEPVEVITRDQAGWASFEALIAPHVTQMESRDVARFPWSALSVRHVTPVTLEVMCMAPGARPDSQSVYFEATKRYEPSDKSVPNPCGVVTFLHGWVQRQPDGVGVLDKNARALVTDCSMWNAEFTQPLGVIRIDGSPIWIVEISRWGSERYELVQMKDKDAKVLLSIPGGSCAR